MFDAKRAEFGCLFLFSVLIELIQHLSESIKHKESSDKVEDHVHDNHKLSNVVSSLNSLIFASIKNSID